MSCIRSLIRVIQWPRRPLILGENRGVASNEHVYLPLGIMDWRRWCFVSSSRLSSSIFWICELCTMSVNIQHPMNKGGQTSSLVLDRSAGGHFIDSPSGPVKKLVKWNWRTAYRVLTKSIIDLPTPTWVSNAMGGWQMIQWLRTVRKGQIGLGRNSKILSSFLLHGNYSTLVRFLNFEELLRRRFLQCWVGLLVWMKYEGKRPMSLVYFSLRRLFRQVKHGTGRNEWKGIVVCSQPTRGDFPHEGSQFLTADP